MEESPFEEFNEALDQQSYKSIIQWWERRRIWYNVAVGLAGIVGVIPSTIFYPIWFVVISAVFYGVLANICYTMGWSIELFLLMKSKDKIHFGRYRLVIFILGLIGSVILTFMLGVLSSGFII